MSAARKKSPPFQFGIRGLLAATAAAAAVCSVIACFGFSGEILAGLLAPVCLVVYQWSYAIISRWMLGGSWDGAYHGLTAVLALMPLGVGLCLLLLLLL